MSVVIDEGKQELSKLDFAVVIASLRVAQDHLRETYRVLEKEHELTWLNLTNANTAEIERQLSRCADLIAKFENADTAWLEFSVTVPTP